MKTFTEFLIEGRGFSWNGSKYSSGFGRYTKDGESISKEEYQRASEAYKNGGVKTKKPLIEQDVELAIKKISSKEEITFSSLKTNFFSKKFDNLHWDWDNDLIDEMHELLADDSKNTSLRKFLEQKTNLNLTGDERLYKWSFHTSGLKNNLLTAIGKRGIYCVDFLVKNEVRVNKLEEKLNSLNIDKNDYVATITEKLKNYTENSSMTVRCSVGSLIEIIDDGRFKTQYETGTTGGGLDISGRSNIELMGPNVDYGIDISKRPVYGCLKQNVNGVINVDEYSGDAKYGDCVCVMKNSLRDRTTFCFGDSKDRRLYSSPLSNPEFKSFFGYDNVIEDYKNITNEDFSSLFATGKISYPEIQIHDGVKVDDIDYVIITSGKRKKANKELIKNLESAGIKYVVQEEKK
jgi:hypothetical protein